MNEVDLALQKIRTRGHDVWIAGPASEESIDQLEYELRIQLPKSLRSFLSRYGALGIGDQFISGILNDNPLDLQGGSIYADTMLLREDHKQAPDSLLVILQHDDGAYCLDSNQTGSDGEFGIVKYENASIQHLKPIAINFKVFLFDWFLNEWDEKDKPENKK